MKKATIGLGWGNAKMAVSCQCSNASAWGTLQKTLLNQKGFNHVFNRLPLLADASRNIVQPDRSSVEAVNHGLQQLSVHHIKALGIDVEHRQRQVGNLKVDLPGALDLCIVAHPS